MQDQTVEGELVPATSADSMKAQIDAYLEVRSHMRDRIAELLQPEIDYYEIKGRKSLAKPGAEKLAAIMRFRAAFAVDKDTMGLMFPDRQGWIAYVCTLTTPGGEFVAEGRGADGIDRNQGDPNKAIKMCQKRAYIDAVIRATGLSDIFTQDLDDMQEHGSSAPQEAPAQEAPPAPKCPQCGKAEFFRRDNQDPDRWYCWRNPSKDKLGCGWKGPFDPAAPEASATPSAPRGPWGSLNREPAPEPDSPRRAPVAPSGAPKGRSATHPPVTDSGAEHASKQPSADFPAILAQRQELDRLMLDECLKDDAGQEVIKACEKTVNRYAAKGEELAGLMRGQTYLKDVLTSRKCMCDIPF